MNKDEEESISMNKVIFAIAIAFTAVPSICPSEKAYEHLAIAQRKIAKRQKELSNEIVFTDHAREQMEARDISVSEVERAIKYGTRVVGKDKKSIKYSRDNIIVVMDSTGRRVITVYSINEKKKEKLLTKREHSLRYKKAKQKKYGPPSNITEETQSFVRSLNP